MNLIVLVSVHCADEVEPLDVGRAVVAALQHEAERPRYTVWMRRRPAGSADWETLTTPTEPPAISLAGSGIDAVDDAFAVQEGSFNEEPEPEPANLPRARRPRPRPAGGRSDPIRLRTAP